MSTAENDTTVTFDTLFRSFAMIIFSEIGDKTFLIAAILAMRHPRLVVFAGAFSSLLLMSLLSAEMGHVLPRFVSKKWVHIAAGMFFLLFGAKMMMEAHEMRGGTEKFKEEMRETEVELETVNASISDGYATPLERLEEGQARGPAGSRNASRSGIVDGARNFCNRFLGPVYAQSFLLTFLGEWGDRSQIATIALGATHNVYLVTLGTVIGHSACTGLAVIAGQYASTKISVKHVTLGGAVLFLIFGVIYLYEALHPTEDLPLTLTTESLPRDLYN